MKDNEETLVKVVSIRLELKVVVEILVDQEDQ